MIFAIIMQSSQPRLAEAIRQHYPNDHFSLSDTQWFVSATGTAIDVTARLGIYDSKAPDNAPIGSAIVLAVASYYGRGPQPLWDWMKVKLEAPPRG